MILLPHSRCCRRARRSVTSPGSTSCVLRGTRMSLWQGRRHALVLGVVFVLATAIPGLAAGVHARFDLSSPSEMPYPTDLFTAADPSHNTGVRVNLPKPNCAVRVSDCLDIDVLNTLDGFNMQPRVSIPFSGAIDVATVSSANVFFLSLGDTLGGGGGQVVGINQVVWDPATNTLHAESDELLDQHTRYALVVTRDVRDAAGGRIEGSRGRHGGDDEDFDFKEFGDQDLRIAALSIFTTQSVTSTLEKIRASIKHIH